MLVRLVNVEYFNEQYNLQISLKSLKKKKVIHVSDQIIDNQLILAFVLSLLTGVWYFMKKVSMQTELYKFAAVLFWLSN